MERTAGRHDSNLMGLAVAEALKLAAQRVAERVPVLNDMERAAVNEIGAALDRINESTRCSLKATASDRTVLATIHLRGAIQMLQEATAKK